MSKARLLTGVAIVGLMIAGAASAQQAAPQPAAQECSGLGCLLGSGAPPAARSPAEAKALQDNQRAAEAAAADESTTPKASKSRRSRKVAKATASKDAPAAAEATAAPAQAQSVAEAPEAAAPAPAKKATKPVHTVTIAADGPEVKRLEQLVATLPKEKIRIVKPKPDGATASADFAVSTALEPSPSPEKTKLFTEQLHIVAGSSVSSVADLNGKIVSFGPDKSPGQAAARKAFEALNVKVNETPLDPDNALDGLATGDVAAVVMLAPQPIDRLKTLSASGVHLLSWPEGGSLPDGANSTTIDPNAYPALAKPGETIRAVGVDAMLVMSPRGAKANAAKSFLKSLSQHAEMLGKRGFDLSQAEHAAGAAKWTASAAKF